MAGQNNCALASTRDTHEVTHLGQDEVFTAAEVATAMKGIKSGKAAGEDEIRPEMLKALTGEGILWLTRVCQAEVESRTQGSSQSQGHKKNPRPRPRTAFPRTDTLEAKDRNARGQGPRTQAQVLSKKKKRSSKKLFKRSPKKKKGLHKNFSSDLHEKMFSKKFFKRSTKF